MTKNAYQILLPPNILMQGKLHLVLVLAPKWVRSALELRELAQIKA
jgi:hypothetical protein